MPHSDIQTQNRTPAPILRLDHITKDFGGVRATSDVSVSIAAGERVGVIGPNGAGKTTLFKLMSGDQRPTSGRVELDGRNVTRMSAHRRARAGVSRTFQITNLFPTLTLWENLLLATRSLTGPSARQRAHEIAEQLDLGDLSRPVDYLAYGEQRRLELALALCGPSRVLLLDEPAAGLGPQDRERMAELIASLPQELTVLLIEHDIDLTLGIVDRVLCLHYGELVADEPSDRVHEHPVVREIYLGEDTEPTP